MEYIYIYIDDNIKRMGIIDKKARDERKTEKERKNEGEKDIPTLLCVRADQCRRGHYCKSGTGLYWFFKG